MSFLLSLGLSEEEFTQLFDNNAQLRSMCTGYAREHHVRNHMLKSPGVVSVEKMKDSDRSHRYDFLVETTKGAIRVEVKSSKLTDKVLLRASDSRHYEIEDMMFNTRSLPRGSFDVLCMVIEDTPYYIASKDIPNSCSKDVPEELRHMFMHTCFELQGIPTLHILEVDTILG